MTSQNSMFINLLKEWNSEAGKKVMEDHTNVKAVMSDKENKDEAAKLYAAVMLTHRMLKTDQDSEEFKIFMCDVISIVYSMGYLKGIKALSKGGDKV